MLLPSQLALSEAAEGVQSGVERVLYLHHLVLDAYVQLGPALVTTVHVATETNVTTPLSMQIARLREKVDEISADRTVLVQRNVRVNLGKALLAKQQIAVRAKSLCLLSTVFAYYLVGWLQPL